MLCFVRVQRNQRYRTMVDEYKQVANTVSKNADIYSAE